jgi:hypothetical protein
MRGGIVLGLAVSAVPDQRADIHVEAERTEHPPAVHKGNQRFDACTAVASVQRNALP